MEGLVEPKAGLSFRVGLPANGPGTIEEQVGFFDLALCAINGSQILKADCNPGMIGLKAFSSNRERGQMMLLPGRAYSDRVGKGPGGLVWWRLPVLRAQRLFLLSVTHALQKIRRYRISFRKSKAAPCHLPSRQPQGCPAQSSFGGFRAFAEIGAQLIPSGISLHCDIALPGSSGRQQLSDGPGRILLDRLRWLVCREIRLLCTCPRLLATGVAQ